MTRFTGTPVTNESLIEYESEYEYEYEYRFAEYEYELERRAGRYI